MPETQSQFKLTAQSGLGMAEPVDETWPDFSVHELAGLPILWVSVSAGGEAALSKTCEKAFGTGLPEPRRFADGGHNGGHDSGQARIIWAGERQWFVTGVEGALPGPVGKACHATDQSDGWIAVRITGRKTREVMEKLCGIDLHESVFPTHAAARAPIEGMISLIVCEDATAGTFVLFFQRSSARSFLEHLRHAAHSTSPRH